MKRYRPSPILVKVVESIKEGSTVFQLTSVEARRGDLVYKPDRRGGNASSRVLSAMQGVSLDH